MSAQKIRYCPEQLHMSRIQQKIELYLNLNLNLNNCCDDTLVQEIYNLLKHFGEYEKGFIFKLYPNLLSKLKKIK